MIKSKFKEILSYFFPLQIQVCSSLYNSYLEVILSKGKYLLNSKDSNYSYGDLHTIFKNAFSDIKIDSLNLSNCLLLGLGRGCVVNLLRKEYHLSMAITAVEIDPVVIELGNKYFNLADYKNLKIVNEDAYQFVKNCASTYDLIVIDVYVNDEVPSKFLTKEFIGYIHSISHLKTIILFNQILNIKNKKGEYSSLIYEMTKVFGTVSFLSYSVRGIDNKIICVNAGRLTKNQIIEEDANPYLPGSLFNPTKN